MSRRTTLQIAASFGAGTEKAFKTTVEIDRLIDNLRSTEYQNVSVHVNSYYASCEQCFHLEQRVGLSCKVTLSQLFLFDWN